MQKPLYPNIFNFMVSLEYLTVEIYCIHFLPQIIFQKCVLIFYAMILATLKCICVCMHVCMCACVRIRACVHVCMCTCICVHVCMCACVHVCVCICVHVHVCLRMRACVHARKICIHICFNFMRFLVWNFRLICQRFVSCISSSLRTLSTQ